MNIRLVIADNWPTNKSFEDDTQITQYVNTNCNNVDELTDIRLKIEDFSIPDNLDRQLVLDICTGKEYHICFDNAVDFYTEYHQSWIFVLDNNNQYVPFYYIPQEL
jgi:hypothetical protein